MTAGRKVGRLAGAALGWTLGMAYIVAAVGCNGAGRACVWDDAGELVDWGWWGRQRRRRAAVGPVEAVIYVRANEELRAVAALMRARPKVASRGAGHWRKLLPKSEPEPRRMRICGVHNQSAGTAAIYLAQADGSELLVGSALDYDELWAMLDSDGLFRRPAGETAREDKQECG